jgi:nitrite reductase/ring-hydroxylating ferredoxin subunit
MSQPGWIAVGLSADLAPGTSTSAFIEGRELVVWRDSAGTPHVWDDRCPHRGMRMSFGFVRGDKIACLYHGWRYDGAGQCRFIPAHPELDVPETIRVVTHPALEFCGLVWVCLDAEVPDPPDIGASDVTPVRSVYIDRPLAEVVIRLRQVAPRSSTGAALALVERAQHLWTIEDRETVILVAGQPVDATRSALHVVLPGTQASAEQAQVARWVDYVRDTLDASEGGA